MANTILVQYVCCAVIFVGLFAISNGDNCEIEGISNIDWISSFRINTIDTHEGEIFSGVHTNTTAISSVTFTDLNNGPYVDVKIVDDKFVISTLEIFKMYEEYETFDRITFTTIFNCARGPRQLITMINIVDTNNHPPSISEQNFKYKIYTPISADFPISQFFGDMLVRDVDLTNYNITTNMAPNNYLKLDYLRVDPTSVKNHFLDLRTARTITSLNEPVTIEFTVTDVDRTGDARLSATGSVTIESDPTMEIPVTPIFEDAFYKGVYENNDVNFEKNMTLSQGYDADIVFAVAGDDAVYFNVNSNGNNVAITLKSPIPDDIVQKTAFMLFTLTATNNDIVGSAAIHVSFPKEHPSNVERPLFESAFYSGTYVNSSVALQSDIKLTQGYNSSAVFSLKGEYDMYFDVVDDNNNVTIVVKSIIPDDIINNVDFMLFTLSVLVDNLTESTAVHIAFPKDIVRIKFKQPSYEGTYSKDHVLNHSSIELSEGYSDSIKFTIDAESEKYFKVSNVQESVFIEKLNDLPESILNANTFLNIIIGANDVAHTTLTIKLPDTVSIKFKEPSYVGNYSKDHVLTHQPIFLEIGYSDKVLFSLDSESDLYFRVTNINEYVTIEKKIDLPQNVLDANTFLNLIIKADDNLSEIGYTILTVLLPERETTDLKFQQPSYEGSYSKDHLLSHPPIELSVGYNENVEFTIDEESKKYFKISNVQEIVQIEMLNNLPESVLNANAFLNVIINANNIAHTMLTIILPDRECTTVRFKEPTYRGSYSSDHVLDHDLISLDGRNNDGIIFTLDDESQKYFRVTNDQNYITVVKNADLPQDVLVENSFLNVIITASDGGLNFGYTILTVLLPDREMTDMKFEQPSYEGSYSKDHVLSHPPIELSVGYNENVEFTIDEESKKYFKISNVQESVQIEKLNNLPESVLNANAFLNVIINANNIAHTTLTIILPDRECTTVRFKEPTYRGNYSSDHVLNHDLISLDGRNNDGIMFTLDDESHKYFRVTNDQNYITVVKNADLPQNVLDENSFLNIIITASDGGLNFGYTTVVIQLPDIETTDLKFRLPSYEGRYTEDHVLSHPEIILDEGYFSGVTFSIQEEARKYFTVNNNNERVEITKKENLPQEIIDALSFYNIIVTADDNISKLAHTTLTLALPGTGNITLANELKFADQNYVGLYMETGQVSHPEIRLSEGFNSGVVFVIEGDMSRHFGTTSVNEQVSVTVREKLPQHILDTETYLVIVIWARSIGSISGFTTISMNLPDLEIVTLRFRQPSYRGTYDTDHKVTHPEIQLEQGFNPGVVFTLQEDARVYFNINNNQDRVIITTKTNLPQEILDTNAFLNLVIVASNNNTDIAFTTLTLSLPNSENCSSPTSLVFSEQSYNGEYKSNNQLTHPEIRLSEGYRNGVIYEIEGDMKEYFDVDPNNEMVKIVVKNNLPQEFLDRSTYLNLIIWARALGSISGFTTLSIDLPEKEIIEMKFSEPFYKGSYDDDHVVTHPIILLDQGYSDDVKFTIPREAELYFSITNDEEKVTIGNKNNLPEDVLESNTFLNLVIWAENRFSTRAFTTLTLSLSGTETSILPRRLRFAEPNYVGEYSVSNELSHPVIRLVEGYNDAIVFTIEGDMAPYFDIRNKDEVVTIIVRSHLPQEILIKDTYVTLVLWAKAFGTISGFTTLTIDLPNIAEVGEFPSLVVTRIFENREYEDVLSQYIVDCDYEITESWPQGQTWFKMQNGKLGCSKVDREDETIAFLPKSQVQVELTCTDANKGFNEIPVTMHDSKEYILSKLTKAAVCEADLGNRNWIYTGNVHNTPNKRLVTILVEDENDNSPDFGITGTLIVGYPSRDLVAFARPASLTTLHATDLDICHHADIRYSTSNDHFTIHPKSGAIYPRNNALDNMEDSFTFKVTAADEDGNGRKTDLDITVKLLDLEHVAFISVKDALLENTQTIVDDISLKLPISVNYLTSFAMPMSSDDKNNLNNRIRSRLESFSIEDDDLSLGIFIYAIDGDKNVVDANNLLSLIKENIHEDDIQWSLEGLPLSDSNIYDLRSADYDDVGYIIAVSILSVFLFLLIVAIVVWFVVIMPRKYRRFNSSEMGDSYTSSEASGDKEDQDIDDTTSNAENNPVTLEAIEPTAEPYYAYVNESTNDDKPVAENKKATVSFKETVQQIDILDYGEEEDETNDE